MSHVFDKSRPTSKAAKGAVTLLLSAISLSAFACLPAPAYDDYQVDTSEIGRDSQGTVSSGQILELGVPNANGLRMEGESYLHSGHLNEAIRVLQRSVELAPSDVDSRMLYAEALEKKLLRQPRQERDPGLYNFVVKQWLCVAKSGEFGDQMQQGFTHLVKLTGTFPKRREKEKKYLERVLIPEDGSVPVVIGARPVAGTKATTQPIAQKKVKKDEEL
jgi:hypothetical protein